MTDPLVSVVMVSYHTGPCLQSALEAALAQPAPLELILVDNGNPDDVRAGLAALAAREPRLHLVAGHGNIGFARGSNLGARRARGRYLLVLNPDTELSPDAVARLVAEGERLSRPWLLGPRILNPDGSEQRGDRRGVLTPGRAIVEGIGLYRLLPVARFNREGEPLPAATAPVAVVSGAAMFLTRDDFWAVGGFDERYFLHVEDIDFCYRFTRAGGRVFFAPHVTVTHHRGSSRASPVVVEWHKTRGFLRYFWTHFRTPRHMTPLALASAGVLARFGASVMLAAVRRLFRC